MQYIGLVSIVFISIIVRYRRCPDIDIYDKELAEPAIAEEWI